MKRHLILLSIFLSMATSAFCASAAECVSSDTDHDGSFEYYMSEPIRNNDPKAVGPFIMACIMLGL